MYSITDLNSAAEDAIALAKKLAVFSDDAELSNKEKIEKFLPMAIGIQRNAILYNMGEDFRRAHVLADKGTPSALESIAMQLGQTPQGL